VYPSLPPRSLAALVSIYIGRIGKLLIYPRQLYSNIAEEYIQGNRHTNCRHSTSDAVLAVVNTR